MRISRGEESHVCRDVTCVCGEESRVCRDVTCVCSEESRVCRDATCVCGEDSRVHAVVFYAVREEPRACGETCIIMW